MAYVAYITQLKNLRKHPNADRLLLGECFGNTVCVGLEYKDPDGGIYAYIDGEIGIYFPTDGQLSVEFCEANNLVRKKDDAGNNIGGYMDPDKRNVTSIRLRGEKSDGLFLPLCCLTVFGDITTLKVGDTIDVFNGHEICCKYIPRSNKRTCSSSGTNKKKKKVKAPTAPLFTEHIDTSQLAYNLGDFKPGDLVEITLKMHGTSQRTGYLPTLQKYKRTLWDRITGKSGTPIYDWGYVSGTRRTVLENYDGGFYGSNTFREQHSKIFEGKLRKGETVYYEVVGFTDTGTPIMATCDNKKLNDKDFIKQYGPTTTFSYGCVPYPNKLTLCEFDMDGSSLNNPQSDIYVYRMTMTNEDGDIVEYTPDFMRYRCEQMGIKTVPVMWSGFIPEHPGSKTDPTITAGEWIKNVAEMYYDGPDPVGKTHVREGVVIRIINRPKFAAYKHKNFEFKCLSGIAIADAEAAGMDNIDESILEEM